MSLTVSRSDLFPVGTSVKAYLGGGHAREGKPSGAAVETQTVQADGSVTFSSLSAGKPHTLHATVGGQEQRLQVVDSPAFSPRATWKATVAARRAAIGTS